MEGPSANVAAPQTVAEVEQLVVRLYQPGPPALITSIQEQLQRLQRGSEGLQLADALLSSRDKNVRFFGALTFQVKLNNDGATLDHDTARQVLARLLHWLTTLNRKDESAFVQKKLCSTLATYFLQSPLTWQHPLLHLGLSVQRGEAEPPLDAVLHGPPFEELVPSMTAAQLTALLWFAATLADDVGRLDNVSPGNIRYHDQMERIVPNVSSLFLHALRQGESSVRAEALRAFLAWVNYAQPMWPTKPEAIHHLRVLIEPALQCSLEPDLETEALGVFRDLLEGYTSFFEQRHMDTVASLIQQSFGPRLSEGLKHQDSEVTIFAQLVIAYAVADVQDMVEEPQKESSRTVLQLQLEILAAPDWPGDDDNLVLQAIEFWNTYIEYATDTYFSTEADEKPQWAVVARQILTQASELFWSKMRMPPPEVIKEWSEDEKGLFKDLRMDTADLLSSIFVVLGRDMVQLFVQLTLRSLHENDWRAVEAGMYCLNALADNVLENATSDDLLASVFGSTLFHDIADFNQPISPGTRRTAIDLLGNYGTYFERHPEFLPDALRFLFASLQTASLANVSAKSISSLCFTCRYSLTGELDGFLQQYERFMQGPTNENYTQEKVMGAIAAIIQALTPESVKAAPLGALIGHVEGQISAAKEHFARGDGEAAEHVGVGALACLASIGRASQVPDDVPIKLDDDAQAAADQQDFWETESGRGVQQRIMGCFSILETLGNNGDAIDAACQVLRSGYTEITPGPFVLPPSVTVNFLEQCSVRTPQLESVLATVGVLVAQHSTTVAKRIDVEVNAILHQVLAYVDSLVRPTEDPGIAQSCIDVLARMTPFYANVFFSMPAEKLNVTLDFTLMAMNGPDPLPKRSACEFWVRLIKLLGPPNTAEAHNVRPVVEQTMSAFGLKLSQTLLLQISGSGSRSDLDFLCEPLKALIFRLPQSKSWLETAMFNRPHGTSLGVGRLDDLEKKRFLQQIIGLRGKNETRAVVRGFYIASRGTVSFGS